MKKPDSVLKSATQKPRPLPQFAVVLGTCLGHQAYRGFGSLADLARISKADIFDQHKNPLGTQRNLSVQHARKAYQYVTGTQDAFYPELILNVRDASYIKFTQKAKQKTATFGTLKFVKDPALIEKPVVSRLDGNHRLWFAAGADNLDAVDRPASFCILMLEDRNKELALFRDINDNQMGMNTSHLQNITARLLGEKALKVTKPALYIVRRLQKDKSSPLYEMIHEGGKVHKGATLAGLTIANLASATKDMLSRSAKLGQFPDADAQFEIIKNYWSAVKQWLPEAWEHPRDYMIFKGVGLYAISYVGIDVIDRSLMKGKFGTADMLTYLRQLPKEALAVSGTLPYAGRGGGRKLANDLIGSIADEGEMSVARLQKIILQES